jgi:hypothetical protein
MKTASVALACLAALSAVVVVACGDVTDPGGCDFREATGPDGPENRCQERRNFQATSFAPACEALGAVVVEGGCNRDGVVAGCDLGNDVVDFYYEPSAAKRSRPSAAATPSSTPTSEPYTWGQLRTNGYSGGRRTDGDRRGHNRE